ncbi:MAG: DUF1080 domain-containing protein [Pirellulales bacterium]|nr:DUF1080 domain-containing protein [Pirellulales bacterium]
MRPNWLLGIVLMFIAQVAPAADPVDGARLSPQEEKEGFVLLFHGKDLDGWQGSTDGYVVENGLMVCKKQGGGMLFTKKEYGNFAFRFEFKLEPAANNGVGIRTPLGCNPAYCGMEIQILDTEYKNIQPWQAHGSIYGVVPAKTGFLNPAGQWNSEEIRCSGRRVTVTLNGEVIVDADLDKVKPVDGHDHPGLKQEKGYIGFLGHGSRIEFRNIRIKEL